jgi:hypothetical protein
MTAPDAIKKLVETFALHKAHYKSAGYNETELRREFLDPFFKALGWDVDNEAGYADAYKDVIHEDAIKIGGDTKAPDYCFRIGGARKYFVEAKKPSIDIRLNVAPAFQLRRYGWSAKLPLSILTDFEEFAVYDTRVKPANTDKPSAARTLYVTFDQYVDRWEEIYSIFARESVLRGSFDQYAETSKKKRGTGTVDYAFLEEIERWRESLAKNLALRNAGLSVRDLNYAVQKIIDRIIFLRICEDRGTEDYKRLRSIINGERIYPRLLELFYRADDRYNSGLFHFDDGDTSRATPPDNLTPNLGIDNKVLKDILKNLYYPESPYEFSVLPADILGQVYERFLGKTIRLTSGHQAKIEEKPEVRKAGGVYYTPDYIVDYIVKNTLGRMLDGDEPDQPNPIAVSKAAEIKVLDPACGSGSFLIVAYQYLLDWHLRQYSTDTATGLPDEGKIKRHAGGKEPKIYQGAGGIWRLTTAERKRILLNNIHGVDIDSQAVEVTKLSLLLKVLEGETQQQLQRDFLKERQRILPDLGKNIQCGNSLIGPDFYDNEQMTLLDDETQYRINVFDWNTGFPEIMKQGGFDCVIGNPPYIRIQAMKEWAPLEVEWYKRAYRAAAAGNYDIYVVFVEKGLSLLNKTGKLGYILPHKFFNAKYGAAVRGLIADGRHLAHVVHFGAHQVFDGATTYTCLLFLNNQPCKDCLFEGVSDLQGWKLFGSAGKGMIDTDSITAEEWNFAVGEGSELVGGLKALPVKLGDIADIFVGLQTSADDVYILDYVGCVGSLMKVHSKVLARTEELEPELLHPLVSGQDVSGYAPLPCRQFILFPYEVKNEKARLIPYDEICLKWPKTAAYLSATRRRLEDREKGKFKDSCWHRFGRSQNLGKQSRIKICVPRLVDELCAGYDENGAHFLDNVDVGGVTLKPNYQRHDLRYISGLLNTRLMRWFFPNVSAPFRGGWYSANRQFLSQLPIRTIDFNNPADVAMHDRMVQHVQRMLDLHKKKAEEKNPNILKQIETQISVTNRQIDRLVYELYGLSEEEIAIVERQDA